MGYTRSAEMKSSCSLALYLKYNAQKVWVGKVRRSEIMLPFCSTQEVRSKSVKSRGFHKNNKIIAPMRQIGEGGYYG